MRYLLLSVLVVCIIGFFAIPQAFADERAIEYNRCIWDDTQGKWDCSDVIENPCTIFTINTNACQDKKQQSGLYGSEYGTNSKPVKFIGNPEIALQNKLDEYWNCGTAGIDSGYSNQDCIKPDWKHEVGISPTGIADYRIEKDGTLTLTYEYPDISKKLEKFRDRTMHQYLWDIYTPITPKQILSEVVYFVILTDDYVGDEAASVDRDPDIPLKFDLFVDPVDIVPSGIKIDKQYFIATMIRENAHILSLSENQSDNKPLSDDDYSTPYMFKQQMTKGERSCANYYNDLAGCMNENSYLNAFFQKFWAGIYHDYKWSAEFSDPKRFEIHNDNFYWKYEEHWITSYATTSPDEDFAESFLAFVLKEPTPHPSELSSLELIKKCSVSTPMFCACKEQTITAKALNEHGVPFSYQKTVQVPYGCGTALSNTNPPQLTIQDQKKNFFYQYPELVEMRSFIRNAIATSEFCDGETVWSQYGGGTCVKPVSPPPQQQTQQSKGGGCLIATATFGSEMAPQIQFLRELRDNTVLQTESGTSFMAGFNQFYYSFSPAIADYERENPVFKETIKLALTPLLTSLTLLQYADIDSESEMLGYGIGVILLNIGMYFVAPAVLIMTVRKRI